MRNAQPTGSVPEHAGLAYERYAPVNAETGKVPDAEKDGWLQQIERIKINSDYPEAYARWERSLSGSYRAEFTLDARLLIGHGAAAPSEVGLTIHRTWGVPVVPGSALKGLLAHWISTKYGPDSFGKHPLDPEHDEPERAPFQPPGRDGAKIARSPGRAYRALFGAPDADSDEKWADKEWSPEERAQNVGAARGYVVFEDALYVPGSVEGDRPWAADVLTVHQKQYYDKHQSGKSGPLPSDYDSPNPVSFLTVRPGTRFLIALSGADAWVGLAAAELEKALAEWGVGAKTSSGYGHMSPARKWTTPGDAAAKTAQAATAQAATAQVAPQAAPVRIVVPEDPEVERFKAWWVGTGSPEIDRPDDNVSRLGQVDAVWIPKLNAQQRSAVAVWLPPQLKQKTDKKPALKTRLDQTLQKLREA